MRRIVANIALLAASLLVGLTFAEIGLRAVGYSDPSFYTRDPIRGYAYRPGAEGWQRTEGEAYVRINSAGFRDREHTFSKPPGTLRIALLGDSFVAAFQVPMEKTFGAAVERELSRCAALGDRKVEVLNFGVGGYGTAQELLTLRYHVWQYAPDIIILTFTTGNDIRNNSRALNEDPTLKEGRGSRLNESPYFVYRDGRLVLDDSFRKSPYVQPEHIRRHNVMADIMNRVRLLQLLNYARLEIAARSQAREAQTRMRNPGRAERVFGCASGQSCRREQLVDAGELGLDTMAYYPPDADAWKEAWRVTEGLLLLMRDEVRQHGAEFWLVIATNGIQVHPAPAVRRAFMQRLGVDTLLYADLRLQRFAEREDIPVVALAVPMAAYAEEHRVSLHGFKNTAPNTGHWNETGHRVAGDIVASRLCAARR